LKKEDTVLLEKINDTPAGDKTLFGIKEVSELLCVHQQTLRNWERKKVLVPLRAGDRRVYTAEHIELCRKIMEFSGKGVPLKGIKELINKI
jgi:DNA-binding transcriptional MerR regulator